MKSVQKISSLFSKRLSFPSTFSFISPFYFQTKKETHVGCKKNSDNTEVHFFFYRLGIAIEQTTPEISGLKKKTQHVFCF